MQQLLSQLWGAEIHKVWHWDSSRYNRSINCARVYIESSKVII